MLVRINGRRVMVAPLMDLKMEMRSARIAGAALHPDKGSIPNPVTDSDLDCAQMAIEAQITVIMENAYAFAVGTVPTGLCHLPGSNRIDFFAADAHVVGTAMPAAGPG